MIKVRHIATLVAAFGLFAGPALAQSANEETVIYDAPQQVEEVAQGGTETAEERRRRLSQGEETAEAGGEDPFYEAQEYTRERAQDSGD